MKWHYASNGQQMGPVSDEELAQLTRSGAIQADSLIWTEGMPEWQPLATAAPHLAPGSGVPMADKATTIQQMREGVSPAATGSTEYAGFWIRFGAWMIDYIILTIISTILIVIGGVTAGVSGMVEQLEQSGEPDPAVIAGVLIFYAAIFVIVFGYKIVMVGKWGATVGKMAVGLKVITADGGKVSYMRATGRAFAEILSGMILYIGYIIAGFDDEKRSLHDHICGTRVVFKR